MLSSKHAAIHITHMSIHLNGQLEGEGITTGTSYNLNVSENYEANVPSPTGEVNLVAHLTLISRGSEPDFHLKASQDLTINAKGEIVVNRTDLSQECVG
jgi:hypothetical protein